MYREEAKKQNSKAILEFINKQCPEEDQELENMVEDEPMAITSPVEANETQSNEHMKEDDSDSSFSEIEVPSFS